MCILYKRIFLCGCESGNLRKRCVAKEPCKEVDVADQPFKSHFKCYDCLRKEAREEFEAKIAQMQKEEAQRELDQQVRIQHEDEMRRGRDRKAEMERQRREGGAWTVNSGNKKMKGKKSGGARGRGQDNADRNGLLINGPTGTGSLNGRNPSTGTNNSRSDSVLHSQDTVAKNVGKTELTASNVTLLTKSSTTPGPSILNGAPTSTTPQKENVAKNGVDPGGRPVRFR